MLVLGVISILRAYCDIIKGRKMSAPVLSVLIVGMGARGREE